MTQEQGLIVGLLGLFVPLFITLGLIYYDIQKSERKEKKS